MSVTMGGRSSTPYVAAGFQMIHNISIRNFRCYQRLDLSVPKRLNIIVGDNGAGKTTLLEAIFLTLATSPEVAMRFRQVRGLEGQFSGTQHRVEAALWGDIFYNRDTNLPVSVVLDGDSEENRKLTISRGGSSSSFLPLGDSPASGGLSQISSAPVIFEWTNSADQTFPVAPIISAAGISLPSTGEDMANFFGFQAGTMTSAGENAGRFSDLSQAGRKKEFLSVFRAEYPWIADLNIEVYAGAPVIFATLADGQSVPLPMVSGGINRIVGILLAIASRPRSVVTIDEVDSGIYYTHHQSVWRALIRFMRSYDSQLFVTTHSKECLESLVLATDDLDDVGLWRVERTDDGPTVRQFSGDTLQAGLEYGEEVR